MPKPTLGPVAVGDRLLVIGRTYTGHDKDPIEATATKIGRAWITLTETSQVRSMARTWRMRLDTQDDGTDGNYLDTFRTPEQHAWQVRTDTARRDLFDAGIMPSGGSPWGTDETRLLVLADFIRAYDTEHPTA